MPQQQQITSQLTLHSSNGDSGLTSSNGLYQLEHMAAA